MTRHYFRSIRKDAKRKRLAREYERVKSTVSYNEFRKEKRVSRLYESYSKAYDELEAGYDGAEIDKWSKKEFSEYLSAAEKKEMNANRFITKSVSLQIGVMTRSEAINLRRELADAARAAGDEEYAAKVSGMSIQDVRNKPVLQKKLYNYLRKSGMDTDESSSWWTENIIGSD